MGSLNFGVLGDHGDYRINGSRFYYNPGAGWSGINRNYSTGPALTTVANMVKTMGSEIVSLGDNSYVSGASSLIDEINGRHFNEFMAPYPSPKLTDKNGAYRNDAGVKVWPYDLYNYPNGFRNPSTGGPGGSSDSINHFWPTIGNHDYGLRIGYGEVNTSIGVIPRGAPAAQSSTPVPQPYLDYHPWLADSNLAGIGKGAPTIKTGKADGSANSGIFYSVELGTQENGSPLIEVFALDTPRLFLNAAIYNVFTDGYGPNNTALETKIKDNYNYDPSKPFISDSSTAAVLTSDAANGQAQFNWLKQGLADSQAKWKIITGHHPAYSSGSFGNSRIDDHASTPLIQKLLNGLPEGSFDAYINGHSHYYQRVLEGNQKGIGQGIPFITIGNSGRHLYPINESRYGDNVYYPLNQTFLSSTDSNKRDNKRFNRFANKYLLRSNPETVGISGGNLTLNEDGDVTGFNTGSYGYGFGAMASEVEDGMIFFNYKQPDDILDPAIAENLKKSTRNASLKGWETLTKKDWKPSINEGMTSQQVLDRTAQIEITLGKDGSIKRSTISNPGQGYMTSQAKQKRTIVDFEIRGNDALDEQNSENPNQYGIVRLTFRNGQLKNTSVINEGIGYTFAMQAERFSNQQPKKNLKLGIPLNLSLAESWYGQTPNDYQDWYLITDTKAKAAFNAAGDLEVIITPKSTRAKQIISNQPLTTGYSGKGSQNSFSKAQAGNVSIEHDGTILGSEKIIDGIATFSGDNLPDAKDKINVTFSGDSLSSYLINYKPSISSINVKQSFRKNSSDDSTSPSPSQLLDSVADNMMLGSNSHDSHHIIHPADL